MIEAAIAVGWRVEVNATEWKVELTALPPLARSRPERNRWPNEPEEGEEPPQEEREREWAPDWDVNDGAPTDMVGEEVDG